MHILPDIPNDFVIFLMVAAFSLLIGIEQRRIHGKKTDSRMFGAERTYALIGIFGFILYNLSPENLYLFAAGGAGVTCLLGIFYWKHIDTISNFGITSIMTALITYSLSPLLYTKPVWVTVCVVTTVLTIIEMKDWFIALTGKFSDDEFIILAKFLTISGIILPLLPQHNISPAIPISPFKFWLVVVVVSAVSYLSYLLKKFVFPNMGMLVTGFIGGLYSSTATTVVLARKSHQPDSSPEQTSAAILLATGMMFIRIYALALIFNLSLARALLIPFLILTVLTLFLAWGIIKFFSHTHQKTPLTESQNKNPLEFKTALIFAALFVLFAGITHWVLGSFGSQGLNILALIVGVTDIDPFLMSLFTGNYPIDIESIARATLIAIFSNNLIKLTYAISLGSPKIRRLVISGFGIISLTTVGLIITMLV